MSRLFTLLNHGIWLHCPVCGKGKLFCGVFKMYEHCPVCTYKFEREEGYFTSAMAIDIVISEFLVTAFTLPLAYNQSIPIVPALLIGAPFVFILPLIFYRHSRALWMSMDHYFHPLQADEIPQPIAMTNLPDE